MKRCLSILGLVLCLASTTACRAARGTVYVTAEPPPPPMVIVPDCPADQYEWIEGHYVYLGEQWLWLEGAWVPRPGPRALWVPRRWARHDEGYLLVGGYWRNKGI